MDSTSFPCQDIKIELLHVSVNHRKNDFIARVLDKLCSPPPGQTDETDGNDVRASDMLDRAILFATLNDDPESLEDILKWGEGKFPSRRRREDCEGNHSPILYACLKDYTRCITILYSYGYRVSLPEEEANIISKILATNDAVENEYNFYMKLYAGERHVDQFYQLIGRKKKMKSETDPVERLLSIKAFANPHYIATEFMGNCDHKAVDEVNNHHLISLRNISIFFSG